MVLFVAKMLFMNWKPKKGKFCVASRPRSLSRPKLDIFHFPLNGQCRQVVPCEGTDSDTYNFWKWFSNNRRHPSPQEMIIKQTIEMGRECEDPGDNEQASVSGDRLSFHPEDANHIPISHWATLKQRLFHRGKELTPKSAKFFPPF